MKITVDTDDIVWWNEPNTNKWLGFFIVEKTSLVNSQTQEQNKELNCFQSQCFPKTQTN